MTWYHGTRAALSAGDRIVPGVTLGLASYENGWNDTEVWLTTVLAEAWEWADAAVGERVPVVYVVQPTTPPLDWAEQNGWEGDEKEYDEWITEGAVVESAALRLSDAGFGSGVCKLRDVAKCDTIPATPSERMD